jgi:hypothetical protein
MDHLVSFTNVKQIRQALTSIPVDLTQAYQSTINRILRQAPGHVGLSKRVLGWVTNAKRPLSMEELQHALAVEDGISDSDLENIDSPKTIISVCISLVTVNHDQTVQLIHITAYEFLKGHDLWPLKDAQSEICRTLITYLSILPLTDGLAVSPRDLKARMASMPLLSYAARYWGRHAVEAENLILPEIFSFYSNTATSTSSFQALHYQPLKYEELADTLFASLPGGVTEYHVAAYWGIQLAVSKLPDESDVFDIPDDSEWIPLH